jgi:hypothetical protein
MILQALGPITACEAGLFVPNRAQFWTFVFVFGSGTVRLKTIAIPILVVITTMQVLLCEKPAFGVLCFYCIGFEKKGRELQDQTKPRI